MSAKHTSGPWIATEARHREIEITTQARIDSSQGSICEMDIHFDGVHGIEQPANARLIAVAPELLQLVIDVIEDADEFETDWNKAARAIVAKATAA